MSSLKFNLDAKVYIPRFKINANTQTPLVQPQASPKTPFHQSYSTQIPHHTSLNINSKSFLPKNYMKKFTTVQPQPPKPKEKKVYKEYFVIDEDDKQQFNFDYDYMISFEKWEI